MENMQNNPQFIYTAPNSPFPPKPEKKLDLELFDYIFFGIFALATLGLVFCGLFGGMGIGYTITSIVMIVTMAVYMHKNGEFTFVSVSTLLLAVISALVFGLYSGDVLTRFIAFNIQLVSSIICMVSIIDDEVMDNINNAVKLLYSSVIAPFENVLLPIKAILKNDKKKTALQIGGAVLAAIPVLVIVIPLLVSADAAFEGLVDKIASSLGMTILKLIITVILLAIVLSFATSCRFELNKVKSTNINLAKARKLKSPFAVTFLGMISLVYIVYLFSQTAYFFSAFSGILPQGYEFSFAQYARRGFFETEAIAFINLLLMSIVLWLTVRRENGELNPIVKGLMTFITVFSILFIITALSKMVMYISEYGLTVLRLGTSVFMLATVVVLIAFIIRIFNSELKTVKYAVIISMALFIALAVCGIDRTVAHYNVYAYLSGMHKNIDLYTLGDLSESAIPYIYKLTECGDETIEKESERIIYELYDWYLYDSEVTFDEAGTKTYTATYDETCGFTLSEYFATKYFNEAEITWYYEDYEYYDYYESDFYPEQIVEEDETVVWDEV